MAGDRVDHLETEILRKDGMPVPISLSLCPVLGDDGTPAATVLIARDITEQRLAQASLAEIEARIRESEALANVGSWLWDLRTGTVQWSDEFHRIHSVDPLVFDGTLDAHLRTVHEDDRELVSDAMEMSVGSGRAFELEYRIVRPNDEVRVLHARAQPMIGSDGAVVGLRGIGQDITDRRQPTD
jgi:PAS domain-containing protein